MILSGHDKYLVLNYLEQAMDNIDRKNETMEARVAVGVDCGGDRDG